MAKSVTIRDVPDEVRDALASQAALSGRSLQEHLSIELRRLAERPNVAELLDRVRRRKQLTSARCSAEEILRYRDEERR